MNVQFACQNVDLPAAQEIERVARAAVSSQTRAASLTVRLVAQEEGLALNRQYRGRESATNVLSFPFEAPECVASDELGDIVLCVPVLIREAREQQKSLPQHCAHLVVHGCLHLLGYDHQNDADAACMEAREVAILAGLGWPDPYAGGGAI